MPARLAVVLLFLATAAAEGYDALCEQMIQWSQVAGQRFNTGDKAGAKKASKRVDELFEQATALSSSDPQAYITYATFLSNSHRFRDAVKTWQRARDSLSDEVAKQNPSLRPFVAAQIVRNSYAFYVTKKDKVYAGGQGNMTEAHRLLGKALEVYGAPQVFFDRGTMRVMASETDPSLEAGALEDFQKAQEKALSGWVAGQQQLGVACDRPREMLDDPKPEEGSRIVREWEGGVIRSQPASEEIYGGDVVVYAEDQNLTLDMRFVEEKGSVFVGVLPQGGVLSGDDGVIVSPDACTSEVAGNCACRVHLGSQSHRINLAGNLQLLDVYGQSPTMDGRPKWYEPQTPPRFPPFRGVVPGTPPLPRVPFAATVVQFAGAEFYHWMTEALGRLLLLEELLGEEKEMRVIMPASANQKKGFVAESLDMVGFNVASLPKSRRVEYQASGGPPHPRVAVERLVVPSWKPPRRVTPSPSGEPTASAPASVLRRIRAALAPSPPPTRDVVLWLSRPRTVEMRKVRQDAEVAEVLRGVAERRGLKFERFEKPPALKEAAKLFARAVLVAGVHGGAFANLVFSPPGTKVLEVGFRTPWSHDYVHMSQALGFEHSIVQLRPDHRGMGNSEVEVVDVEFVGRLADELLGGVSARADSNEL
eukprot:Hpha_TRINITY_DN10565_c0_g1::TRINITY_DN10565_c0_g1_i1::g.31405::m.31405